MQRYKYIHFKICRSTSLFASCWHRKRQSLFAHAYIQSVVLVENGALYRTALTHFNGWKTKILSLRLRYELISKRLNYQSKYTNTSGRAHANPFNWKCRCKFWQFLGPRLCLLLEVSCDDELPRRSVLLKLFLLIAGPLILVFSFHPRLCHHAMQRITPEDTRRTCILLVRLHFTNDEHGHKSALTDTDKSMSKSEQAQWVSGAFLLY